MGREGRAADDHVGGRLGQPVVAARRKAWLQLVIRPDVVQQRFRLGEDRGRALDLVGSLDQGKCEGGRLPSARVEAHDGVVSLSRRLAHHRSLPQPPNGVPTPP